MYIYGMIKPIIVKSHVPPSIIELGGKHYIVPTWKEVNETVTRSQLKWVPSYKSSITIDTPIAKKEIISSRSGDVYLVSIYKNHKKDSCTCMGFKFKRKCKHIGIVKKELNLI